MTALPISVAFSLLCVCISVCLFEWPLEQMWILHHLHNRPRVYCLSCTPSCSSQRDPPPPCHSPGVQKVMMSVSSQGCPQGSWNAAAVSRNPSGLVLRWRHRQIRTQIRCYVSVHVHFPFVCMQSCYISNLVDKAGECHRGDHLFHQPLKSGADTPVHEHADAP